MPNAIDRVDPSELSDVEIDRLSELNELLLEPERPVLCGREGVKIPLPDAVFHILVNVVQEMKKGSTISLFPENQSVTTKAAANCLGMSRPYFVRLLEANEIPYHKVGSHRRVYMKDLLAYRKKRDSERRALLDSAFDEIDKAGVYDNG